jgi:hypothetical protein
MARLIMLGNGLPQRKPNRVKWAAHLTPLLFTEYLSRFWRWDVQNRPPSLVRTAVRGAKPLGHGKGSCPEKRLKYSVNVPSDGRSVSSASSTPLRPFGADCTFQCNDSNIPRRYSGSAKLCARRGSNPQPLAPEANALSS